MLNYIKKYIYLLGFLLFIKNINSFAQEVDQQTEILKKKNNYQGVFIFEYGFGYNFSNFCVDTLNDKLHDTFQDNLLTREVLKEYEIFGTLASTFNFISGVKINDYLEIQASIGRVFDMFYNSMNYKTYQKDRKYNENKKMSYSKFMNTGHSLFGSNLLYYQEHLFELLGIHFKVIDHKDSKGFHFIPIIKFGIGYKFDFGLIFMLKSNFTFGFFNIGKKYEDCLEKEKYYKKPKGSDILSIDSTLLTPLLEFSIGYDWAYLFRTYF